jgi:hypothetical protein
VRVQNADDKIYEEGLGHLFEGTEGVLARVGDV